MRLGKVEELRDLQIIEISAGEVFAEHGMEAIARDDPLSIPSLVNYCESHSLWVYVDANDKPIAYIITEVVDRCVHIEQISVHADHSGNGYGRSLIDALQDRSKIEGFSSITLTTFRDVPWNAPYYKRLGFFVLEENEITPGLARIRADEEKHGLNRWPRVCMKLDL